MTTIDTSEKCPKCGHWDFNHFKTEDILGAWEFCMISDCECFIDNRIEEDDPAPTGKIPNEED